MNDQFPDEIGKTLWDEACRRAEAIRGFLKRRSGDVTSGDIALLAAELEVSRATAFRLIKLFRAVASGLPVVTVSVASMKPQEAIATKGNVRRPALRSCCSLSQPIGSARR